MSNWANIAYADRMMFLVMLVYAQNFLEAIQLQPPEVNTAIGIKFKKIERALAIIRKFLSWYTPTGGVAPPVSEPIHRIPRGKFDSASAITRDAVDCTVFAPRKVALGEQA
jgi:hypothetical protein